MIGKPIPWAVFIPCFRGEVLAVDGVWPDTLNNLEDLVADVEFVVKLRVGASILALDVKFHERV